MVFRFIGVVLELLWAIAKREAEIESLKRREDKSEEKLKTLSVKVREMETQAKILESRRELDIDRIKELELRRKLQEEQIARLEIRMDSNRVAMPQDNNGVAKASPADALQKIIDEATKPLDSVVKLREELDRRGSPPAPTQPTDN